MYAYILTTLKGLFSSSFMKYTAIVIGIILGAGVFWYVSVLKKSILEKNEEIEQYQTAVEIMARDIDDAVQTANENEQKRKDLESLMDKYEGDIQDVHEHQIQNTIKITEIKEEVNKDENTKNDGDTAPVLINTIHRLYNL